MQKWEYLRVHGTFMNNMWIAHSVNGQEIGEKNNWLTTISSGSLKKHPNLDDFINELGEQGWEMVNYSSGFYLFKRPKQTENHSN